ncbi:L-lactate dehydrogenase [Deferribacterales bacterium RsTz2092]|nr:L-lactate dehydrogenase [Deferribacterales bacterium]
MKVRKVVIIGAGHVGSHVGFALGLSGLVSDIVFIDTDEKKATAQALELEDASSYFTTRVRAKAGTYEDLRDTDIMFVAAGPLPDIANSFDRQDSIGATVQVLKDVLPQVKKVGYNGIIVSISNPADVIAHYIQKTLDYPAHKLLSTSTTLDSARLKRVLANELGLDPRSVQAYVMGEHGESQIVAWSSAKVAGLPLLELLDKRKISRDKLADIAAQAKGGGWTVLIGKGSTEFGIAMAATEVARAIFNDEHKVLPVATLLNGEYGQKDVYASVPAVVCATGVKEVIEVPLSTEEKAAFDKSCDLMRASYERARKL